MRKHCHLVVSFQLWLVIFYSGRTRNCMLWNPHMHVLPWYFIAMGGMLNSMLVLWSTTHDQLILLITWAVPSLWPLVKNENACYEIPVPELIALWPTCCLMWLQQWCCFIESIKRVCNFILFMRNASDCQTADGLSKSSGGSDHLRDLPNLLFITEYNAGIFMLYATFL